MALNFVSLQLLIRHFRTDKKQQKHSSYVHDERKQLSSRNENIKNKTGTKSQQSAKKVRQEDEKSLKDDIEEYWFFVNQWFSKHDDDNGALIKEFVPTDAQGKPLPGMSEGISQISFSLFSYNMTENCVVITSGVE